MNITKTDDGFTLIALDGRLDIMTVGEIELRLTAALVPTQEHAIIDMSRVDFIASIAIRMILIIAKALIKHQGKLALIAPSAPIRQVLDTAGVSDMIPVVETLEQASAALRG